LPDRPAFGEVYPNDASSLGDPSGHLILRWVREGDFKLLVPRSAVQGAQLELFNLAEDPEEGRNLAGDPQYADRIKRMKRLLDAWWTPGT
jgi:uncharacterized sulfatase